MHVTIGLVKWMINDYLVTKRQRDKGDNNNKIVRKEVFVLRSHRSLGGLIHQRLILALFLVSVEIWNLLYQNNAPDIIIKSAT